MVLALLSFYEAPVAEAIACMHAVGRAGKLEEIGTVEALGIAVNAVTSNPTLRVI